MSQAGIASINNAALGVIKTITGDSGGAVGPDGSGNINLRALYTNTVVGNPGTNTLTVTPTTSGYPITPYVVAPVGFGGYQTIQSAINAASLAGGGVVFIYGSYTENLTLALNVALVGVEGNVDNNHAAITGTHTPPTASGCVSFMSINFYSTTSIFNSNAAGQCYLVCDTCNFILSSTGYVFNLPNWTGPVGGRVPTGIVGLAMTNSGDLSLADSGTVNNSAGGMLISFINSYVGSNAGGGLVPMLVSGQLQISISDIFCPITITNSLGNFIEDTAMHAVGITATGTSTGTIVNCAFEALSGAAFTMSSSAAWSIGSSSIESTATPVIAGAGTGALTLGGISFLKNSGISNTLTLGSNTGFYPSVGTDGQVFLGATKGAGKFASLTSSDNSISFVAGTNTLNLTVTAGTTVGKTITGNTGGALSPSAGNWNILGASAAAGTSPVTTAGAASTLTVKVQTAQAIASTDATKIGLAAFSNTDFAVDANGFVTIIAGGFTWTDVTSATQALLAENGYLTDRGAGVVYTLPATASIGDTIKIVGKLGLTTITPNANQQILMGSASGTVGATGTAVGTNLGDSIELICTTSGASSIWRAANWVGNWTLT